MYKAKMFVVTNSNCEAKRTIEVNVVDNENAVKISPRAKEVREDFKERKQEILAEFTITKDELFELYNLIECYKDDTNTFISCIVYKDIN